MLGEKIGRVIAEVINGMKLRPRVCRPPTTSSPPSPTRSGWRAASCSPTRQPNEWAIQIRRAGGAVLIVFAVLIASDVLAGLQRDIPGYTTAYGHMSAYAKGLEPGKRVRQGQVIGYVGSTGLSTGPHCHYEILVNNKFVTPTIESYKAAAASADTEGWQIATMCGRGPSCGTAACGPPACAQIGIRIRFNTRLTATE